MHSRERLKTVYETVYEHYYYSCHSAQTMTAASSFALMMVAVLMSKLHYQGLLAPAHYYGLLCHGTAKHIVAKRSSRQWLWGVISHMQRHQRVEWSNTISQELLFGKISRYFPNSKKHSECGKISENCKSKLANDFHKVLKIQHS